MVTTKQETLLGEKDQTIGQLKQEVDSLERSLSQRQEEVGVVVGVASSVCDCGGIC